MFALKPACLFKEADDYNQRDVLISGLVNEVINLRLFTEELLAYTKTHEWRNS